MKIEYAAFTHVGRRANNEDAHCAEPGLGLYAVADGMGGYEGGEVASRLVIDTLIEFFRRNAEDADCTWPHALDPKLAFDENLVAAAVSLAHRRVHERRRGRLAKMGSTVVAVAVRPEVAPGRAVVAHVGDSRVYRLRAGALEQLTRDHSLYAELEASGAPDLPAKEDFPYSNVITRALGLGDGGPPDLRTETLRPGDTYLLCSDGLTEPIAPVRMAELLGARRPAEACRALVEEAYERGGRDNITAVVLRAAA